MIATELTSISREPLEDFYGMSIFKIDGAVHAASTINQAEIAARKIAGECLDLIETELILKHAGLPHKVAPLIKYLQDNYYLSEVDLLKTIIDDPHALTEEAMARYGRQHFLGLYDQIQEQSLGDFPQEVEWFILTDLGVTDREQVCIYKLD